MDEVRIQRCTRRLFSALVIVCFLLPGTHAFAQNWKQVHKKDDAKWAKATGLYPLTVHKLWRAASHAPYEKDDDSRIADLDLQGLAERHDVLLVTYAGEKNCLTLTVFRQLSETQYSKVWSVDRLPDGGGFCDTPSGSVEAEAHDGTVVVRVPLSAAEYMLYGYEWNGITYRLAGQKKVQDH